MDERPIGLFDSGVGGLSVLDALRAALPAEEYVYLADSINAPYGSKSESEVAHVSANAVNDLLEHDCKLIVFACNTASTVVINHLRALHPDVPMVAVVPMVKPAAALTKTGTVAVFATQTTLEGGFYAGLKHQFAAGVTVLDMVGDGWVELVEAGILESPRIIAPVQAAVSHGADVIVLGCTHYPFLRTAIETAAIEAAVLDSGAAVARQVRRVLKANKTLNGGVTFPKVTYLSTGDSSVISQTATALLGQPVTFTAV